MMEEWQGRVSGPQNQEHSEHTPLGSPCVLLAEFAQHTGVRPGSPTTQEGAEPLLGSSSFLDGGTLFILCDSRFHPPAVTECSVV